MLFTAPLLDKPAPGWKRALQGPKRGKLNGTPQTEEEELILRKAVEVTL